MNEDRQCNTIPFDVFVVYMNAVSVNNSHLFASGPESITVLSSATCTTDMAVVAVN